MRIVKRQNYVKYTPYLSMAFIHHKKKNILRCMSQFLLWSNCPELLQFQQRKVVGCFFPYKPWKTSNHSIKAGTICLHNLTFLQLHVQCSRGHHWIAQVLLHDLIICMKYLHLLSLLGTLRCSKMIFFMARFHLPKPNNF